MMMDKIEVLEYKTNHILSEEFEGMILDLNISG